MWAERGRLLIPSPFLSSIPQSLGLIASILLASSIFLYPEVKEALPDLLIFIINKYVLFSIHYGMTLHWKILEVECKISWNLKGPSTFPSYLLLDLCPCVLGDPAVWAMHTCDFSPYTWSTLHSSLYWFGGSDLLNLIWLFPVFRQHTQVSLYITYSSSRWAWRWRLEENAANEFLEATYIFLQIQVGNECSIHCPYQEFSMNE